MPIIALQNVVKEYPLGTTSVRALDGVSLEVEAGEFLCVAGPSGSGKTTLLNMVGCVDQPSAGTVRVDGRDTGALTERQLTDLRLATIGFIFQGFNLISVLSVFQNVELPLLLQRRTDGAARRTLVMALLEQVGIAEHSAKRPNELSGGQRQRVAVARALVSGPKLVLADEPTANLDSVTGQTIVDLMKRLNRDNGVTFLFSTHDPRVQASASKVLKMVDGRLA